MRRVFLTGLGVATPLGIGVEPFWNNLIRGQSGIRRLSRIDVSDLPVTIGGEIADIEHHVAALNGRVSKSRMDRASLLALVATQEALVDAELGSHVLGDRVAVVIGAGLSGLDTLQSETESLLNRGPGRVSPFTIPTLMPNAAAANISLAFGATGPSYVVSSACSSSGNAFVNAVQMVRHGDCDIAITGGTESSLTRLGFAAFAKMGALATRQQERPPEAMRPFDADRDGFAMSEGAGVVIVESEESVQRRIVRPIAEILGFGMTTDAFHLVRPPECGRGAIRAMSNAIEMAGLTPAQIANQTYVNAHGTATAINDVVETRALKTVFSESAASLPVSSSKSMTGHFIGAACAVETVICALALRHQIMPPTINLNSPDPECDLDYVPNHARHAELQYVLNNSFGFGGHNVCLLLGKPEIQAS